MTNFQLIALGGGQRVATNDIMLLKADVNYTDIYFVNGKHCCVATTLKKLEQRFAACDDFFRTHKSFLININYIEELLSIENEDFVQMKNGYRVEVSRRRKRAFKQVFRNRGNNNE